MEHEHEKRTFGRVRSSGSERIDRRSGRQRTIRVNVDLSVSTAHPDSDVAVRVAGRLKAQGGLGKPNAVSPKFLSRNDLIGRRGRSRSPLTI